MKNLGWFLFFVFLILLFLLRLKMSSRPQFISGAKIKIIASLREEPRIIGQTQRFSLAGVEVRVWRYPEFHYGDRLEVVGIFKETGLEFPEIKILEAAAGKDWQGAIYSLRRRFEGVYRQTLPEPQSSLLSGIVLGSKSEMPSEFWQSLRQTGTLHVVVASGMNVTIVASTLASFFVLFLSRKWALIFAFLGIWFYVLLAGAEAPVVRAGMMGSLAFLAQGLGREADAWRGLGLAAIILLLLNPQNLFDLGFQLSFLATAGILFFGPKINTHLSRVPNPFRSDISQTLGAQIATLPLILFVFGQYSPLSPLTNILVVTILPLIMKLGALVAIGGLVFLPLGQILAWLTWPLLTYFAKVVELFSRI